MSKNSQKMPANYDTYAAPESYMHVYSDLDDTLILWCADAVNLALLRFLVLSKRRGKGVHLITRSPNPEERLGRYGIEKTLFDSIICVKFGPKSSYIARNGIFFDDNKAEREEVSASLGIPCFDPLKYYPEIKEVAACIK